MVNDEQLYRYLLGDVVVGAMYNSPLPYRKDDTPSFGLYEGEDGVIRWKDFGAAQVCGDKAINLLMEMKGLSYHEAKDMVRFEIEPGTISNPTISQSLRRRKKHKYIPFLRYRRRFLPHEAAYWKRFYVEPEFLTGENIFCLVDLTWVGGRGEKVESEVDDPAFVYWFKDNPASWKLYRPLGDKMYKFRQHNISGVIEGWGSLETNMKEGDPLIITSSTKDRVVIKKHVGVQAINPTGETAYAELLAIAPTLQRMRFTPHIMYDGDEPGWKATTVLANKTGWKAHDMRGVFGPWKDPSDYIDTERGGHSPEELSRIIKELL